MKMTNQYATICYAVMSMTKDELDYYEEQAEERKE